MRDPGSEVAFCSLGRPYPPLISRQLTANKAFKRASSFCSGSRPYLQNEDPIDFASVGVWRKARTRFGCLWFDRPVKKTTLQFWVLGLRSSFCRMLTCSKRLLFVRHAMTCHTPCKTLKEGPRKWNFEECYILTSMIPTQCSTNWAIKPSGSWTFCEFVRFFLAPLRLAFVASPLNSVAPNEKNPKP